MERNSLGFFVLLINMSLRQRCGKFHDTFLLGVKLSFGWAQYGAANVVLEKALERIIVGDVYCDIPLGLYVIRGENVVLIGELDPAREELPANMIRVSATDIKKAQKAERDATDLKGSMRKRMEFLDLE
eukprot:Gb_06915 [translate_table: standard]